MTGFVGQYRNVFLVDVVQISNKQSSLFNVITSIVPYILNFFIVMYIDGRNIGKKGKFRPLIMLAAAFLGLKVFGAGGILLLPVFAIIVKSWLESKGRLPKVQNKNKGGAPLKSVCFDSMKKKKCKKLGTKSE